MEDKTSKKNATMLANALIEGLKKAQESGGVLLNTAGKQTPMICEFKKAKDSDDVVLKTREIPSAFNAVLIAVAGDEKNHKTNLVMTFSEARKAKLAIQGGEHSVPFQWYSFSEFQNKADASDILSKKEYFALGEEERQRYKAIRKREMSHVFNIDQTTMPFVLKEMYKNAVAENGVKRMEGVDEMEIHKDFNKYLKAVTENLVSVKKDGKPVSYDPKSDVIHLPHQKDFATYEEYCQEANRQILTATGHQERLDRKGMDMNTKRGVATGYANVERLIIELASAKRQMDFGMGARLSAESMPLVDGWIKLLEEKPSIVYAIERDVNMSVDMVKEAAKGKKVSTKSEETLAEIEKMAAEKGLLYDELEKFSAVKVDGGKYAFYIKPKGEDGFTVIPEESDVRLYFKTVGGSNDEAVENIKKELASKYSSDTEGKFKRVNPFYDGIEGKERIANAMTIRPKDDPKKFQLLVTLQDGKKRKFNITENQWRRVFIAPDRKEYLKGLAAAVIAKAEAKEAANKAKQEEERKAAEAKQKAEEPKRKEQERKEAEEREKFRKEVILPAIATIVKFRQEKNDENGIVLANSHGSMVAIGPDAEKLSESLNLPINEFEIEDAGSMKVVTFSDTELEAKTELLDTLNVDYTVSDENGEVILSSVEDSKDENVNESVSNDVSTSETEDEDETIEEEEEENVSRGRSR